MRVLFVAAEMAPFAKVGGVADVVDGLGAALRRRGHEVSVLLPLYRSIDREALRVRDTGRALTVFAGGRERSMGVLACRRRGLSVYLLDHPEFFDREGIYGADGEDYPDNAFRFAALARAGLELARGLEPPPDVFHVHDWQAALLPVYQKLFYRGDEAVGRRGVVLSIHNMAYQGIFPREVLPDLGLPWEVFHIEGLEFYERVNFLKGGLVFSEKLTTVSPTYAKEIQTEQGGHGLEGVVRKRADDLVGIVNGIDRSVWNPAKDAALVERYDARRPEGKAPNKAALQRELGLAVEPRRPLFAFVGRLDAQKGLDLLEGAAPALLARDAQLVVLGSGRSELVASLERLAASEPARCRVEGGFKERLGRRIYAGADLFLMPSRWEPCGLGQMIALRYGTVPVVRRTGGLADTIVDVDAEPTRGNGFVFGPYRTDALLAACDRALARYASEEAWRRLVVRGMRQDFGWGRAAAAYEQVYAAAARAARGTK